MSRMQNMDDLYVGVGAVTQLAKVMPPSVSVVEFARIVAVAAAEFGTANGQVDIELVEPRPEHRAPAPMAPPHASPAPVTAGLALPAVLTPKTAPRSGQSWTIEEEDELRRLRAEGIPMREVAARLDRPFEAVRKRLQKIAKGQVIPAAARGVGENHRPRKDGWTQAELDQMVALRKAGKTFPEIAAVIGRNADAVRGAIRNILPASEGPPRPAPPLRGDVWTAAEDDTLIERWTEGDDIAKIAQDLGRSDRACQVRLSRLHKDLRQSESAEAPEGVAVVTPSESVEPARAAAPRLIDPLECTCEPVATPTPEPVTDDMPLRNIKHTSQQLTDLAPKSAPANPCDVLLKADKTLRSDQAAVIARPEGLTGLKLSVWNHLARLSTEDYTPADDLYIAESLVDRVPMEVITDTLGCDSKAVLARFQAMKFRDIVALSNSRHLTINGQEALLAVLRLRAASAKA